MSLTLHLHPLSSFCWKVLIALYENETPFTPNVVDLSDPAQRAALEQLWPIGKFPVLEDRARAQTIAESTTIIEYLAQHHPGRAQLVLDDPDLARETRFWDRFIDLYVHHPMQKIGAERRRKGGPQDAHGVAQAQASIETAYAMIDRRMDGRTWAMGDAFTLADCSAMPALYYANRLLPIEDAHARTAAYLGRLTARPTVVRVLAEAQPYLALFAG